MKITIKQLSYGCSDRYETVDVEKHSSFRGYDIYADADGWFYVQINGNWNYLTTINECKMFIKNIFTNN